MSPTFRFSRRHRRDRAARQIAWTALCAIGMVCSGGVWWLMTPENHDAADRVTPVIAPAYVTRAAAGTRVTGGSPIIAASEFEAAELEAPQIATEIETIEPASEAIDAAFTPSFNGRPIKPVRTVRMLVTAYSPDARSCGKFADNVTASGYSVWTNGMKLVAADAKVFGFGTILTVKGYNDGKPVPVLDRGGAIKGSRLDVLYPTHEIARQWGARYIDVVVWDYAD